MVGQRSFARPRRRNERECQDVRHWSQLSSAHHWIRPGTSMLSRSLIAVPDVKIVLVQLRSCVEQIKSCQPPIGLLICDEGDEQSRVLLNCCQTHISFRTGHTLKSASTKTTKALHGINCKRRVILSGTPIQNNLSEYHTMVGEFRASSDLVSKCGFLG